MLENVREYLFSGGKVRTVYLISESRPMFRYINFTYNLISARYKHALVLLLLKY